MRHLNFSKYMVAGLMAASLLTTNTSCADYLDKEPDTELDIEMVFSNRDKVYQWLAFVYNTIHEPDKWRIWKDGYEVFADDLTPSKHRHVVEKYIREGLMALYAIVLIQSAMLSIRL